VKVASSEQLTEMYEQYTHEISRLEEIRKDPCCELSKLDEKELPQLFQATRESILSIERAFEHLFTSRSIISVLRVGPYGHAPNERIKF